MFDVVLQFGGRVTRVSRTRGTPKARKQNIEMCSKAMQPTNETLRYFAPRAIVYFDD